MQKVRNGRLRPQDQVRVQMLQGEIHIGLDDPEPRLGRPLDRLGDVRLEHGGLEGLAAGRGPFHPL